MAPNRFLLTTHWQKLKIHGKFFDIVIEGVSLVTNYRSQFAAEIKNNGIDSLISKLSEKNNKGD